MKLFGNLKHKYLNLNMGLVKENFVIADIHEMDVWKARGFEKIRKYPIFHYTPDPMHVIMLGKPLTIDQFGLETLKNSRIVDFCHHLGTYGMGGPGFVGLKIQGDSGDRWLVYCVWNAGQYILLDNRVLECHPKFSEDYNPWIGFDHQEKSITAIKKLLDQAVIQNISLSHEALTITLTDAKSNIHVIETRKTSDQFPPLGGTGKKSDAYADGAMRDYWLVIYDGTHLAV